MKKIQSIVMIIILFVLFSCNKEDSKKEASVFLEDRKEDRYKIKDSDGFSAIAAHLASPLLAIVIPTYFALTENSYVKEVEIQIKNIVHSAATYCNRFGRMPVDCYEDMETKGLIEMRQNVIDAWDFECSWEFYWEEREIMGTITATSTDANDVGAGKVIEYDILNNEFIGYGQGGY